MEALQALFRHSMPTLSIDDLQVPVLYIFVSHCSLSDSYECVLDRIYNSLSPRDVIRLRCADSWHHDSVSRYIKRRFIEALIMEIPRVCV